MLKIPLHYWVTSKGYILSSSPTCPVKKSKKIAKVSYIGFTFDEGWPKKMNTGRLFYPSVKKKKSYGPSYSKKAVRQPQQLTPQSTSAR